jgi:hypothetical protein
MQRVSPDDEKLDVLIVHLTTESKLQRTRTAIRNFVADHLKTRDGKDAALVAFVSPTEKQWRFSYVKMEYTAVEKEDGKVGVQTKLTPARRSSYIVGENESCHTAQSRFPAVSISLALQSGQRHPAAVSLFHFRFIPLRELPETGRMMFTRHGSCGCHDPRQFRPLSRR